MKENPAHPDGRFTLTSSGEARGYVPVNFIAKKSLAFLKKIVT